MVKRKSEAERRKPEFMYEGITNKETYETAQADIESRGDSKVLSELSMKNGGWTADDTAKSLALMAQYQTEGNNEKAVDVASMLREKMTRAGQAIQALKIVNKLTPEGKLIEFSRNADDMIEKQIKRKGKDTQRQIRQELEEAREKDAQRKWYHESREGEKGEINPKDIIEKMPDIPNKEFANSQSRVTEEKSFTDEVLDRYGIEHLSSDDLDFAAETLNTIDGLDSKEQLIDLIMEQSKRRKTATGKSVRKALRGQDIEILKDIAVQQVFGVIADKTPSTTAQKISTFQAMAQLLNARTMARNILSNTAFDAVDTISTDIGSLVDAVMGAFTGKRTVGLDRGYGERGRFRAGIDRAKQSYIDIALAVNHEAGGGKYGIPTARRTFKGRIGGKFERAMSYGLTVTDEFQKGAISYSEQKAKERLKKSGFNQAEAELITQQTEKYRTFQDDTRLSWLLNGLKQTMNIIGVGDKEYVQIRGKQIPIHEFGLGDIVQKYTTVPGNLISRSVEYSPLGYCKALWTMGKAAYNKTRGVNMSAQTQRNIALSLARPMTGTGLIALFYMLANAGVFTGEREDEDKKLKDMRSAEGVQSTQLNLSALGRFIKNGGKDSGGLQDGDVLTTIGFLEPLNTLMAMGSAINEAEGGISNVKNWASVAGSKTFDQILDMSTMSTMRNVFTAISNDGGFPEVALAVGTSGATGFIPSVARQAASFTDNSARYPYMEETRKKSAEEQVKASLPFARNTVAAKITPFGVNKTNTSGNKAMDFFNNFLNPGYSNVYQSTDISEELYRLAEQSTDVLPHTPSTSFKYDGEQFKPRGKEYERYSRLVGTITAQKMRGIINSDGYGNMSDDYRIAALSEAASEGEKEAKAQFAEGKEAAKSASVFKMTQPRVLTEKKAQMQEKQKQTERVTEQIQKVAERLAAAVPDKAEGYSAKSLQEFDIKSVNIDGKSYDIDGDMLTKVTEAATDEHYSNVEKLLNNEANIEDVIGYTSKGKASTAEQADGTKVKLTGKMYNEDGTPRFDELAIAKIIRKSKEKAKSNAIEKYRSEITGSDAPPAEEKSVKVSQGSSRRFTSAKASGKKSSGGGRKRSSGKSSSGNVRFTSARALLSGRDTARTSRTSSAALPNIMNTNLLRMAASPYIKNNKVSNAVKPLENPLFM